MEESKEIQQIYKIFRTTVYIMLILEFLVYVPFPFIEPGTLFHTIVGKIARFGIYDNLIYSRLAIILMVCVTCIGTKAKKDLEFDPQRHVAVPFISGLIITILSVWMYRMVIDYPLFGIGTNYTLYMILSLVGTIAVHVALDNISKAIKHGLMKDRMNWDGEAFEQERKKVETPESINIPTLFYYNKKMNNGWINIEQPFRGIWVVGVPGSGKTFSIIEPLIRQEAAKGWSMCVYDYKFPTLARKLFYHFEKNKKLKRIPEHATFNVINFVDVEFSKRVNPIQHKYIDSVGKASETAVTLIQALMKGGKPGGGGADDFFKKAAENFLAASIYFWVHYDMQPYDKDWNILTEKKRVVDGKEEIYYTDENDVEKELYRWNGRYGDLPHVLTFLLQQYETIFTVLDTDENVAPLMAPYITAFKNKAMDQLEGMAGTLRVYLGRLITKEAYWILSGDEFDLKISDPKQPSYLLRANDPAMEEIITALNAVILNRLVSEVNTGEGKNNPCSIIVDELPTLYFNRIDRLQGTARSNKVSVALGFQSKEQLEKDYGKEQSNSLLNIFGNVVIAATSGKETVEWLSNDVFGKIKQIKKGVSVTRDQTTISMNEEMMPLVPPDKIANMQAGWLCGMTARSFRKLKLGRRNKVDVESEDEFRHSKFFAKTNFDMAAIKNEEKMYKELPKFYVFGNEKKKNELLTANYRRIVQEVQDVCDKILHQDDTEEE